VITPENTQDLQRAADFLCVADVTNFCRGFWWNSIDVRNCLFILRQAMSVNNISIRNDVLRYVINNYTEVSDTVEFLELDPEVLMELIQDDKLIVKEKNRFYCSTDTPGIFREVTNYNLTTPSRQEEILLDSLLRYVSFKPYERKVLLPLMICRGVRLHASDFIFSIV